ncbi:hypothetical protein L2E82_31782 [Cichorium intybus]|uniref:Uncharacterized protein n=1 Tax=Cichorium intybus TaxID=13427 RepID=A0ACB9BFR3_CICIN|nr:hypothetical protein L2E82_31782 [Cichorium intybus]
MAFNKYLKKLAAHPVIRTSEDLRVFLQAQGNLPLAKTTTVASRMMSPPRGENLDSSIYANLANDSVIGRKESWFSSIKKTLSRSSKEKKTQERIRGGKSFCMIPGGPHLIQEIEGSMVWLSDLRGIWTVCGPPEMMQHISGDKGKDRLQGEVMGILKELGYTEEINYNNPGCDSSTVAFGRRASSGRYVNYSRDNLHSEIRSTKFMNYTVHIPLTSDNQTMDPSISQRVEEQ